MDVAFFRPLKSHWREVLSIWKQSTSASRCTTVPKDEFPRLLKQLLDALKPDAEKNLKSGFRKTGIFPLNRQEVLQRLPKAILEQSLGSLTCEVGEVFLEELNKKREVVTKSSAPKRRKKLNVPPGKSISAADVQEARRSKETTGSAGKKKNQRKAQSFAKASNSFRKKSSVEYMTDEETESSSAEFSLHDSDESMNLFVDEDSNGSDMDSTPPPLELPSTSKDFNTGIKSMNAFNVDDFVVVNFEGRLYPGKVTDIKLSGYMVSAMELTKKQWRWPTQPDEIFYSKKEVLYGINPPKPVGKRGLFEVNMSEAL